MWGGMRRTALCWDWEEEVGEREREKEETEKEKGRRMVFEGKDEDN